MAILTVVRRWPPRSRKKGWRTAWLL